MRVFGALFGFLAALLVAACGTGGPNTLIAEVSRHDRFGGPPPAGTFLVMPESQEALLSEEYPGYADLVAARLAAAGLRPAETYEATDYVVILGYAVAEHPPAERPAAEDPVAKGSDAEPPSAGEPGLLEAVFGPGEEAAQKSYTLTLRTYRKAEVEAATAEKRPPPAPVHEAAVVAQGGDKPLQAVMPYLVEAAYRGFPTGGDERISIELEETPPSG